MRRIRTASSDVSLAAPDAGAAGWRSIAATGGGLPGSRGALRSRAGSPWGRSLCSGRSAMLAVPDLGERSPPAPRSCCRTAARGAVDAGTFPVGASLAFAADHGAHRRRGPLRTAACLRPLHPQVRAADRRPRGSSARSASRSRRPTSGRSGRRSSPRCRCGRRGRCGRCGARSRRGDAGTSKLNTWLTSGMSSPRAAIVGG